MIEACDDQFHKVRKLAPRAISMFIEEMDYEKLYEYR